MLVLSCGHAGAQHVLRIEIVFRLGQHGDLGQDLFDPIRVTPTLFNEHLEYELVDAEVYRPSSFLTLCRCALHREPRLLPGAFKLLKRQAGSRPQRCDPRLIRIVGAELVQHRQCV